MPLYEYECTQCHKHTEKIQKFADAEITVCPHCGGKLERVITAPSVQFKGGGWYADGYGSAKSAKGDSAKSEGSSSSSDSSAAPAASTSESKAAAPAAAPAAAASTTSSDKK
jgi:putative FmdB family regulatory protein